ncbi:MAG TPA: hypothetical protein VHC72_04570, partial [Bryobacteraceae bacterium]|nr:hypothetical protein [Bryobacteraceae bacterium]
MAPLVVKQTNEREADPASGLPAPGSVRLAAKPWQILSGLIVSGFLLALPGGLLPLWGFHIRPEFGTAGDFFLAMGLGVIAGGTLVQRLVRDTSLER